MLIYKIEVYFFYFQVKQISEKLSEMEIYSWFEGSFALVTGPTHLSLFIMVCF